MADLHPHPIFEKIDDGQELTTYEVRQALRVLSDLNRTRRLSCVIDFSEDFRRKALVKISQDEFYGETVEDALLKAYSNTLAILAEEQSRNDDET